MGVYIEGMEMPAKGEYRMTLYVCDDGYAYMDVDLFPVDKDRFEAVPVPPHGRLGDFDSFTLLVLNWISTQEKAYPHEDSNALAWRLGAKAMANQIYRDVKAYPTIIPADSTDRCAISSV